MTSRMVYCALGGNVGDPAATMKLACSRISEEMGKISGISRLYKTKPLNPPGAAEDFQPPYFNAVVCCESALPPEVILQKALLIEKELGRDRSKTVRWGPRTIDIDLLFVGDLIIETEALKLPHPELHKRDFVLMPLCDLAPDLLHPIFKKTTRQFLDTLSNAESNILGVTESW